MKVYNSPDEVRKAVNDSLFNHLVYMVEQYNLRVGKELSQSEFQRIWQSLEVFPQLDVSYYSKKLHLDEKWVDGWGRAKKRGNEAEGYIDTDELPQPNVTVYFLLMAITFLDEKLKPRSNNHASVFAEVEYRKRKAEKDAAKESTELAEKLSISTMADGSPAIGEELAKAQSMPDGRPWDTILELDVSFVQGVTARTRNCLKNGAIGGRDFPHSVMSVQTYRDLVERTEENYLRSPNIGRLTTDEIKEWLAYKGLALGMDLD